MDLRGRHPALPRLAHRHGSGRALVGAAPVLLRVGVLALVLFPGAFGLHYLVDGAEYGSWLYGD
ncbi:DUF6336 family protein [Streptomyces coeruleorubidus]